MQATVTAMHIPIIFTSETLTNLVIEILRSFLVIKWKSPNGNTNKATLNINEADAPVTINFSSNPVMLYKTAPTKGSRIRPIYDASYTQSIMMQLWT